MSCSAEMGMAKPDNGFVVVLVAGAITVNGAGIFAIDGIRNCVGVGTQLYHSEGDAGSRKYMPHFLGANHRINIAGQIFSWLLR